MRDDGRLIIGITGGIAAGKSTVLKVLATLGFRTIDADKVAHSLYRRGNPGFGPVVARFGGGILSAESGEIDRRKLAGVVFAEAGALSALEAIIHPLVVQRITAEVNGTDRDTAIEAIKLFPSGLNGLCDETWFVRIAPDAAAARLTAERGLTDAEALTRIAAQRELTAISETASDWTLDGAADPGVNALKISKRIERLRGRKGNPRKIF